MVSMPWPGPGGGPRLRRSGVVIVGHGPPWSGPDAAASMSRATAASSACSCFLVTLLARFITCWTRSPRSLAATTTSPLCPSSSSSPRSLRSARFNPALTCRARAPRPAPPVAPSSSPAPMPTAGKSATSAPPTSPMPSPRQAPWRVEGIHRHGAPRVERSCLRSNQWRQNGESCSLGDPWLFTGASPPSHPGTAVRASIFGRAELVWLTRHLHVRRGASSSGTGEEAPDAKCSA